MDDQTKAAQPAPAQTPAPATPAPEQPAQTGGPKNVDWVAAQKYYLTADANGKFPSYKDVAAKFEVSETSVEQKASKESWVKLREDLGKDGIEQFKTDKVDEIAKSEDRHLKIWRGLQQTALELLKDLRRDIKLDKEGKPTKGISKASPTTQLRDIVGILETSIGGERLVLGLPNSVSKADITSGGKAVKLTPAMVAEMDEMFKRDGNPTNPTTN